MSDATSGETTGDRSLGGLLGRALLVETGELPLERARPLLKVDLSPADRARFETLSAQAREGNLSGDDWDEFQCLTEADRRLTLWRLKARQRLGLPLIDHGLVTQGSELSKVHYSF